jgi:hypothetical protein
MASPHISERIAQTLLADGWQGSPGRMQKRTTTAGAFDHTITVLETDTSGRWLMRVNGWGQTEREVDLRQYQNDPHGAITAALA